MIDLVPNAEQRAIAALATNAAATFGGRSAAGLSDAEWSMTAEIGVFGLGIAESAGGAGGGSAAEVLLGEAFGAQRAPLGFVAACIAAHALAESGQLDILEGVLIGATRVALGSDPGSGQPWRLLDLEGAALVVILSPLGLTVVDTSEMRDVVAVESLDEGVTLSWCESRSVSVVSSGSPIVQARGRLLLSALAVGIAGEARDLAVSYAREREQVGKPIGAFQAVKHRCVDMTISHEAALATVRLCAVRADAGICDELVDVAALMACGAARDNAASAVQVFGGIGFTVEGGIHHLVRRAWLLERILGPSAALADGLVSLAGTHQ
jgi:alkylation response protein AidB-like acyl-CoA dehydrogenase